jgi:hypothetical protein
VVEVEELLEEINNGSLIRVRYGTRCWKITRDIYRIMGGSVGGRISSSDVSPPPLPRSYYSWPAFCSFPSPTPIPSLYRKIIIASGL